MDIGTIYGSYSPNAAGRTAGARSTESESSFGKDVSDLLGGKLAASADESEDIIEQIGNPNSDFYRDMYNRMRVQREESDEEKKKQAIIDALDAILESLSAKKDEKWKKKADSVTSMAELSQVIDSLDKDDPRKEKLDLLRQQMQNLGIYIDLDVGIKGKDKGSWGPTLTEQLIQKEAKDTEPSIFDII